MSGVAFATTDCKTKHNNNNKTGSTTGSTSMAKRENFTPREEKNKLKFNFPAENL